MSYRLYVRPRPPFADPDTSPEAQAYDWALQDASGDVQAQGSGDSRDTIEQTLARNALDNVLMTALIPADETVFCVADIPARQQRYVQQALPFAVEEQIAQDIETVHLAVGSHVAEGFPVAAIDRVRMAHWHRLFTGWHQARLDAVYPDAALLPVTENGWTVCLDGDDVMMLSHRGEWLKMKAENLGLFAQTMAVPAEEAVIAEIPVSLFGTEADLEMQQHLVSGLSGGTGRLVVDQKPLELSVLEFLGWSRQHHHSHPINLCQGSFANRATGDSPFKPWKPLIAVASIWFVVQLGLEIGMGVFHQQKADALQTQAMAIYREAFPNDRRTHAGNVRRVLEGQLRLAEAAGPNLDFVSLMKFTGDQYSRLPNPGAVEFNSINYSRSRGELVVDVRADSYDGLSQLRNGIAGQGLQAQMGSVVNESSGTRGRLTVSGG
ncbi:MAG: type II secretion system protein GspL [Pseudomonadota bacterium]|nr:type II secretion system protein GspL [Pseudomonadota bacterium]